MSKYIIDVGDAYTHHICGEGDMLCLPVRINEFEDNWLNTNIPLTPYTEPDIEKVREEALDMAISALSCSEIPNSSDSISRQAAIYAIDQRLQHKNDALRKHSQLFVNGMEDGYLRIRSDLLSLPSAQPEIVRCKDCIHNNDCDIQYSAQAGENFFCGFGETEKDVREDVYE